MKMVNLSQDTIHARKSEFFPFGKSRPFQDAAIKLVSDSWKVGYKYVFLEAPTGFGKSALAITLAKEHPNAFILVSTKMLQDQYVKEKLYKTLDVRGRQNFRCMTSAWDNCDTGPCQTGAECKHQPQRSSDELPENARVLAETPKGLLWVEPGVKVCRYWDQKCKAMRHNHPVFNCSYFLYETTYAGDFGPRNLLICDEAHNMEDELMKFVQFSVSDRDLEYVGSKVPEGELSIQQWIETLALWDEVLYAELKNSKEKLKGMGESGKKTELIKKVQELGENVNKCTFVADELSADPQNWIIENVLTGKVRKVSFKPIFVRRWSGKFFSMADRFLLQSATIIDADAMAESLGLRQDECIFIRAPSSFSPEKRPIYYKPLGKMSKEHIEGNLPRLVEAIKLLMAEYPDQKGVIHTHSYKIKDRIMASINSDRLIANDDSRKRDRIISEFIESKEPLILVTPSAYEGVDFKYDICRWQVICKMPYPDLADKQVRKRMELDPQWYQWKTVLRLVQTYGRGMRAEDDWCHTYILDESFSQLVHRNRHMFPEWFLEALESG